MISTACIYHQGRVGILSLPTTPSIRLGSSRFKSAFQQLTSPNAISNVGLSSI
jgi:hypothetical protein